MDLISFTVHKFSKEKIYKVSLIKISMIFSLKNDLEKIQALLRTCDFSITLFCILCIIINTTFIIKKNPVLKYFYSDTNDLLTCSLSQ